MEYLHDMQSYIDRYDLQTIEICLNHCKVLQKAVDEKSDSEEFKKYTKRRFLQEIQKVLNLYLYAIKGQRYQNKAKTIQEWMDRDRREQEKYDNALPPVGITCKKCYSPTEVTSKNLQNSFEKNSQVLFMFRCIKCNAGQAFYEDGKEWVYDPPKCPKCKASLNSDHKDVAEVMTTIYSCPDCSYIEKSTYDFKESRLEREEQETKDKKLLADYRKEFCLSDKEGEEFIETMEAMDVGKEVYEEELKKYEDPALQLASNFKKLSIVELEELLIKALEKEKYTKLSFDKPDLGLQVTVPFTVQDTALREENISCSDLKKLLQGTLEDTNWRLVRNGIHYRLGYLSGSLIGYERPEAMPEFVENKKEQKSSQIDSERRMKYSSHNVVQLQKVFGEIQAKENLRKKRLEKESKGFAIPVGESYSCKICYQSINSSNGWYDKYGLKCLDCQRALNEGVLPPEAFEDDHSWYTDWAVESEFHIPKLTISKLAKEGVLKPRIVTNPEGKHHRYVFMALENNDLLEAYKQKHNIVLICGIPASGKSDFGKYLRDKHNYTYISVEDKEWSDKKMQALWEEVFTEKRQYDKVEKFVCYLYDNYENVALDWGFPMDQIRIPELLKRQWCEVIWFSTSISLAKKRFVKNNKNSATYFDTLVKSIEESNEKIMKDLKPKIIDVLKEDRSRKTDNEIYHLLDLG